VYLAVTAKYAKLEKHVVKTSAYKPHNAAEVKGVHLDKPVVKTSAYKPHNAVME